MPYTVKESQTFAVELWRPWAKPDSNECAGRRFRRCFASKQGWESASQRPEWRLSQTRLRAVSRSCRLWNWSANLALRVILFLICCMCCFCVCYWFLFVHSYVSPHSEVPRDMVVGTNDGDIVEGKDTEKNWQKYGRERGLNQRSKNFKCPKSARLLTLSGSARWLWKWFLDRRSIFLEEGRCVGDRMLAIVLWKIPRGHFLSE